MNRFLFLLLLIFSGLNSNAYAYDFSKKFGLGIAGHYPVPVWGNTFNDLANPEWGASVHGKYHIDQSIGWEMALTLLQFKDTNLNMENANLLAFWRAAGSADLSPVMALGAGVTRIENYVPHNLKLSLLARAGLDYAFNPHFSIGTLVDYKYVSKFLGRMPTNPAHIISPQIALTWYFGGTKTESQEEAEADKTTDVISTQKSATARSETKPELMVLFDFAKDNVKPHYFDRLRRIAERLRNLPDLETYIEGHADSTGPDDFNDDLSLRRAKAVMKKLVEYGADPDRIRAEGFGEDRPIADNDTEESRSLNRRSAVYISVQSHLRDLM